MRRVIWVVLVVVIAVDLLVVAGVTPGSVGGVPDAEHRHTGHIAYAQTACWPFDTPMGALPDQPRPIWCYDPPETGASTFRQGANSWIDDFNHGLSLADLGPGYRVFSTAEAGETERLNRFQYWRHADHWMVDVNGRDQTPQNGPWNFGGTTMRPDRSFRFQQGRLVVEADVAAGISQYDGTAWPELTVTTAPRPTGVTDGLYAYGFFRGHWTFGCRLESGRALNCALFDGRPEAEGGRLYELPLRNAEGMRVWGGGADTPETNAAWRVCRGTDPDTNCRDRFRLELTRDTIDLYVNGVRFFSVSQIPPDRQLPPALLNGDVYVYFASWIGKPNADTVRFHWDRVAVNPGTSSSPPPTVTCTTRPPVRIATVPSGPGRLQVTVTAQASSDVPNNRLRSLRFLQTSNALTDIGGQTGRKGSFTVPLDSRPQQTQFDVRREIAGQPMTVQLVAVDDCGDWQTFVGAGATSP
jgi:hypothetical protein